MKRGPGTTPLPWLGGLLALYLIVPIVAFALRFAGSHNRGFGAPGLFGALYVSVVTATISTAIIAVVGIPLAYTLARSRGRLSNIVGVLVLLPLAMPPLMGGILLVELVGPYSTLGEAFGRHLTGSMVGIVLAQIFVASPFLIVSARSAFAAVDQTISEHAAALGHRELSRFWRVNVPMAQTGIRAGLVLAWLRAFGEFGATVILSYHPYTLPVFTYVQFSSTGIPFTQAPTALGLGVAAVVAFFGRLPRRRRRPRAAPTVPSKPQPVRPTRVSCDLDAHLGTFALHVQYRAKSSHVAVLGTSGSGKSATLRGLAGLLGPAAGTVCYGELCVDDIAVEDRRIGYVPQGYGLFPHLTVWEQANFGVGADPGLAAYWLRRLALNGLEQRYPDELSGGQCQRVALAQALARSPDLLLLDEPSAALDRPVRLELFAELRRLQRETAIPTVIVTHDSEEVAYLADEVIVLQDGQVLQTGSKEEVFTQPSSPEVARLVGVRNICEGLVDSNGMIQVSATRIEMDTDSLPPGTRVKWSIRPDEVMLTPQGPYAAVVLDRVDLGTTSELLLELSTGFELTASNLDREKVDLRPGARCRVALPPTQIKFWPIATETARLNVASASAEHP